MYRVTLDTGVVNDRDRAKIEQACAGRDIEIAHTTVTDREQEGSRYASGGAEIVESGVWDESTWDKFVWADSPVLETFVLDESRLGSAVLGSDVGATRFDAILKIISDGGFPPPGKRDALSEGRQHELRDAMALEAHAREGRDVFVTSDVTHFIKHGRRAKLEELGTTQIMTVDEFVSWVVTLGDG